MGVESELASDQPLPIVENSSIKKKRRKERWSEERKEAAKKEREDKKVGNQHLDKKKSKKNKKEEHHGGVVVPLKPEERVSGPSNATEAAEIRNTLGFVGPADPTPNESNGTKKFSFQFANVQDQSGGMESAEGNDKSENVLHAQAVSRAVAVGGGDNDGKDDIFIPRRVYVGGMPYAYTESDVRGFWEYCGPIESLDLLTFPDTGRFRGIAFITFSTEDGYEAALACDGEACEGQTVKVQKCKKPNKSKKVAPLVPLTAQEGIGTGSDMGGKGSGAKSNDNPAPKTAGYDVAYVGNIAWEADEAAIKAIFEPYGVTKVRLHTDKDTGRPKGYAHVHFKDEASLDQAITLDGTMLFGRRIKVGYAQPKKS
jgi:nucleolin